VLRTRRKTTLHLERRDDGERFAARRVVRMADREVPSSPRSSRAGGEPVFLFDPETSVSGDSIVV
jgi:hypothetical protein